MLIILLHDLYFGMYFKNIFDSCFDIDQDKLIVCLNKIVTFQKVKLLSSLIIIHPFLLLSKKYCSFFTFILI